MTNPGRRGGEESQKGEAIKCATNMKRRRDSVHCAPPEPCTQTFHVRALLLVQVLHVLNYSRGNVNAGDIGKPNVIHVLAEGCGSGTELHTIMKQQLMPLPHSSKD